MYIRNIQRVFILLAAVRKQLPGLYIDLSSIAKGYAVDRIAGFIGRASSAFTQYQADTRL